MDYSIWGLYWGPIILGNCQIILCQAPAWNMWLNAWFMSSPYMAPAEDSLEVFCV